MLLRKYMVPATILMLLVPIFGHPPRLNAGGKTLVPKMSVDQVKLLLGKPDTVIIDVRTPRTFWRTTKKILTAVREDPSTVDQWARKYSQDQTLILY
jgi:hypothetical protein